MKLLAEQQGQKSFCNYVEVLSCIPLFITPKFLCLHTASPQHFFIFCLRSQTFLIQKKKSCTNIWRYLIDMDQQKRVIWVPLDVSSKTEIYLLSILQARRPRWRYQCLVMGAFSVCRCIFVWQALCMSVFFFLFSSGQPIGLRTTLKSSFWFIFFKIPFKKYNCITKVFRWGVATHPMMLSIKDNRNTLFIYGLQLPSLPLS